MVRALRAQGRPVQALKPVISGFDAETPAESDTALLLAALGREANADAIEAISPWRFTAPLSPDMAASREGRDIDFDELIGYCRRVIDGFSGTTLVEGVGGVMVPLTAERTVLDWIAALKTPAILVVGSYLGTLSHTLTAHAALSARAIPLAGIVISESAESPVPLDETRDTLARFISGVEIVTVARGGAEATVSLAERVVPA